MSEFHKDNNRNLGWGRELLEINNTHFGGVHESHEETNRNFGWRRLEKSSRHFAACAEYCRKIVETLAGDANYSRNVLDILAACTNYTRKIIETVAGDANFLTK